MRFISLSIVLLLLSTTFLSGCTAKRELKTAVCIAKAQPAENKCYETLAIDSKDAAPCDRIKPLLTLNGTPTFPTKVTCYAEVAFKKAEPGVCNALPSDAERSECRSRYDLYMETAQQGVN